MDINTAKSSHFGGSFCLISKQGVLLAGLHHLLAKTGNLLAELGDLLAKRQNSTVMDFARQNKK